jgi:pseudaminic acid synthase
MKIGNRLVGKGYPVYIVAELSCNHNQNIDIAIELIHKAKWSGADAVKIQTYTPDTITLNSNNKYFTINNDTIWDGITLYELYKKAYTPWEWFPILKKECQLLGLDLFSSPFDITAIDYLEQYNVPVYKISSFEVSDHILLKRIAKTGKPVILSNGV